MTRIKQLILIIGLAVLISVLSGCKSQPSSLPTTIPTAEPTLYIPLVTQNPVPDTTEDTYVIQDSVSDLPVSDPVTDPESSLEPSLEPAIPFATATPQPNTRIDSYTQVTNSGLGFTFEYPAGWTNIPGRSTVCFRQPVGNGTVYPARVAVTMKKLAHKCTAEMAQDELVSLLKTIMSQYDSSTFQVDKNLDTATKFMGNNAMSTTYLAYDGDQEIEGYVILTYYERYVFTYHFMCAYSDYSSFQSAMRYMRDSVVPSTGS